MATGTTWAPARPSSGCFDLCCTDERFVLSLFIICHSFLSSDYPQADRSAFLAVPGSTLSQHTWRLYGLTLLLATLCSSFFLFQPRDCDAGYDNQDGQYTFLQFLHVFTDHSHSTQSHVPVVPPVLSLTFFPVVFWSQCGDQPGCCSRCPAVNFDRCGRFMTQGKRVCHLRVVAELLGP